MVTNVWKILLIEDDEDDYILTRAMLKDIRPIEVSLDWVSTAEAALEAFEGNQHDAILVDYRLGLRSGLDLVREAISRGVKSPLIMLSGRGNYDIDMEAMRLGAADYLSKDEVNTPLLERTIRYAIERKHTEEELERRVQERTQELAIREETITRLYEDLQKSLQEEQRMRKKLIQSEKHSALSKMLGSVAHELNNPVQTIENSLFMVGEEIRRLEPDSSLQEIVELASSEAKRMGQLVNQLREAYRPTRETANKPLDMLETLEEVHLLLKPHLIHQSVTWEQVIRIERATVLGARDELKQVFLNLGMNAIEAQQPGGGRLKVEICGTSNPNGVNISLQDKGPGIPPENLSEIFDPFFSTKSKGIGLGLSICYDIIERHHGHITVESAPGQGATFSVWLPAAPSTTE